ncbi:hypothetical protein D1007_61380 [Hordeum vulgare]|nr:hypothetical protein D1007_61380 [Hordeum vulgare]
MPITSELHWDVYKEKVDASQYNSLEIFSIKVDARPVQINWNCNVFSPIHDVSAEVYVPTFSIQPPIKEYINARAIVLRDDAIPHVQEDASGLVDDDAIVAQEDVYVKDEEIHYNPIDDEGLQEQLDEDGFTVQEKQIFKKVTSKERGTSLIRGVSIADKVVVDGGMRLGMFEPTLFPKVGDPLPSDKDENYHLKKGIKFDSLQELKIWLCDYAIRKHRPFVVGHSNQDVW